MRNEYTFYPNPIKASPWEKFHKAGPWKVGLSELPIQGAWQASLREGIRAEFAKAKAAGLVTGELMESIQPDPATATPAAEVAGFQRLVREGADLIIVQPLSAESLAPAITEAGEKGVVTSMISGSIAESPYIVNINSQNYQLPTAGVLKQLEGKGNVLIVRGVESAPTDGEFAAIDKKLLSACPDIDVVGEVVGEWSVPQAKTAVQQFLASHPGEIDAVLQHGVMGPGIISAFEQAGRTVPPITGITMSAGEIAWWGEHQPEYVSVGNTVSGKASAESEWRIAMRIMGGKGLKTNEIGWLVPSIPLDELSKYYKPGTELNSTEEALLPTGEEYTPESFLDHFFNQPGEVTSPADVKSK